MNTVLSRFPVSLGRTTASTGARPALRHRLDGARGLSTLLMAAAVAALVVLAERLMGGWAEQHQFLAWVALWLLILAGSAAVSAPARRLARRVRHAVQDSAAAVAEARAEVRLWQAARADHRVMAECVQARQRDLDDTAGLAASWGRFPERLDDGRGNATHLRHC